MAPTSPIAAEIHRGDLSPVPTPQYSVLSMNRPVWDDDRWTPLPPLHGDVSADSCVIGLGGSGLTLVEELLRRDERVVALDAHDVGAGAAGRNGGFLLAGSYDFYHDAIRKHGHARARAIYQATLEEMPRMMALPISAAT